MSKAVQRRRGTTAEHTTFTGALAELTVDTTKDTVVVHDGAAAGGFPLLREDGSNSALAIGSAGTPSLKFTNDPNTGLYSPDADQVAISTGGTERARIDSSGRVGIGTSAPSAPLHVDRATAGVGVQITNTTTYSQLRLTSNGTNQSSYLTFNPTGTGKAIIQVADTDKVAIDSAGRLGIGTTSPSGALDVVAGNASNYAIIANNSNASGDQNFLQFKASSTVIGDFNRPNGTNDVEFNAGYGAIAFGTGTAGTPSERARIDAIGRLLVGTSTVPTFRIGNQDRTDSTHIITKSGTALGTSFAVVQWAGNTVGTWGNDVVFAKSYSGTVGTHTIGSINSVVSRLFFSASDGTRFTPAASIETYIDGAPGDLDMPGRLVFSTTADGASTPTERMRIANDGRHIINSSAHQGTALTTTAPAKLYTSTGTYTDTATAASGTVTHGTIVAFDNPAIAATNATVTYTNASTVYIDGAPTNGTNVTITNPFALFVAAGASRFGGNVLSSSATGGIGYATGAGSAQTQATSRTQGVTINTICGAITLFSAAGTTTWQSFTVTNSTVAATDTVIVNQKSGTDLYMIHVTNVAAGSFQITYATTGGTTTEQPVFNFSVIKAVAA